MNKWQVFWTMLSGSDDERIEEAVKAFSEVKVVMTSVNHKKWYGSLL